MRQKKIKRKIPRNIYAVIASQKPKQIFHHRSAPRGGDSNEFRDIMDEYLRDKEEEMKSNPRYIHDCNDCVYLGEYDKYDLYYCPGEPTVIARWSSDGPDYSSGICFKDHNKPLGVAFTKACELGYLNEKDYKKTIRCSCGIIRYVGDECFCGEK